MNDPILRMWVKQWVGTALVILTAVACQMPGPERLLQTDTGDPNRPPDLYLADGSPCWYLRSSQWIGQSRWTCDIENQR